MEEMGPGGYWQLVVLVVVVVLLVFGYPRKKSEFDCVGFYFVVEEEDFSAMTWLMGPVRQSSKNSSTDGTDLSCYCYFAQDFAGN